MAWITRDRRPEGADSSFYNITLCKPIREKHRLARKDGAVFWTGSGFSLHPKVFHRMFRDVRLRRGAGPIERKALYFRDGTYPAP